MMIRNRNRRPNNHTPHRPIRIILRTAHILRAEIRQQIDKNRTRQLRRIRPRPLRPRIRLRRPRQRAQPLPERERRDGAGDGDRVFCFRGRFRLRGEQASRDEVGLEAWWPAEETEERSHGGGFFGRERDRRVNQGRMARREDGGSAIITGWEARRRGSGAEGFSEWSFGSV